MLPINVCQMYFEHLKNRRNQGLRLNFKSNFGFWPEMFSAFLITRLFLFYQSPRPLNLILEGFVMNSRVGTARDPPSKTSSQTTTRTVAAKMAATKPGPEPGRGFFISAKHRFFRPTWKLRIPFRSFVSQFCIGGNPRPRRRRRRRRCSRRRRRRHRQRRRAHFSPPRFTLQPQLWMKNGEKDLVESFESQIFFLDGLESLFRGRRHCWGLSCSFLLIRFCRLH